MLPVLLALQLATADSLRFTDTPSSPALRDALARAAAANAELPRGLAAYRARAETEIALLIRRPDGAEAAGQLEQVASEVRWSRGGPLAQHIVGLRTLTVGFNVSMLSFLRDPWVVPLLYGNRLLFPILPDSVGRGRKRRPSQIAAIHPFSAAGASVYAYSGGDTVAVLTIAERRVPIVRIRVVPRTLPDRRALLFEGTVDIDADRGAIVRMRGHVIPVDPAPSRWRRLQDATLESAAFVELENAEVHGRYWLPIYQRIELQAAGTLSADSRSVVRMITRFADLETTEQDSVTGVLWTARVLTSAPADSLGAYRGWRAELGAATGATASGDFDDIGPEAWRPVGRPRLQLRPAGFSELFRFNRIEGVYTGYGAALRFRDAAPGLTLRANAGWAWTEETARGGAALEYRRRRWVTELRAERVLANTKDFRAPLDYGTATFPALLYSLDNFDYVDRRLAAISLGRELPGGHGVMRVEAGVGSDLEEVTRRRRGLWIADSLFRPNRGVDEGRYLRTAASIDINPNVSGDYLQPGVGARLRYERGDGDLDWQRVESQLVARRNFRSLVLGSRLSAGALFSDRPPPQQLFEMGRENGLSGYDYKAFAGDRAALLRSEALWRMPLLRAPIRLRVPFAGPGGSIVLPGASPGLVVGVQSGWTEASSGATRDAMRRLGVRRGSDAAVLLNARGETIPVSRETRDIRTTIDLALRLFGGIDFGVARAIDRRDEWRFYWGI